MSTVTLPGGITVHRAAKTLKPKTTRKDRRRGNIALREIDGNLTLSGTKAVAWYRLNPIRADFLTHAQQEDIYQRLEIPYCALAGHDFRWRITHRPVPREQWRARYLTRAWTQDHPHAVTAFPNPAGREDSAARVTRRLRQLNMIQQERYLGVTVGDADSITAIGKLPRRDKEARRLRTRLHKEIQDVESTIVGSGLGTPATAADLEWLEHKSVGLLLPEPMHLNPSTGLAVTDMGTFTDGVQVDPAPFGPTIRLTARASRNGAQGGGLPQARIADLADGAHIMLDVEGTPTPVTIAHVPATAQQDAPAGHRLVAWAARDGRGSISTFADDALVTVAPVERYVAILSLGRVEDQETPGRDLPWLAAIQRLPFPVEVSAHITAQDPEKARKRADWLLKNIRNQRQQREQYGMGLDREDDRVQIQIEHMLDRITYGSEQEHVEFDGVYRLAVAGPTEKIALERAKEVADLYKGNRIKVEHPEAQYGLYTEFDLGSEKVSDAYTRHMFSDTFVRALPQMDSAIGDGDGDYLGYTIGGSVSSPVFWDSHKALYTREISGLTLILAGLGGGKSSFMGSRCFHTALNGIKTTVWDPSGPLARLCYHPKIAPWAMHLDLLDAPDAILCPFSLIPDPHPDDYDTNGDAEYARDCEDAQRRRRALACDVARMLLDPATRDDRRTDRVLMRAANRLDGSYRESMEDLTVALAGLDPAEDGDDDAAWGRLLARALTDMRTAPYARLIFGSGYQTFYKIGQQISDAMLLVITMAQVETPKPGSNERRWTLEQRMAVPLMHLGAFLTARRIYDGPMSSPKAVGFDEAHRLRDFGSGQELFVRIKRDSRKYRLRAYVATHNGSDVLGEDDVENLTVEVVVGRTESETDQADALRLLRVADTPAHRSRLARLSEPVDGKQPPYRDFVIRLAGSEPATFRHEHVEPVLAAALNPEDDSFLPHLPERLRARTRPTLRKKTKVAA